MAGTPEEKPKGSRYVHLLMLICAGLVSTSFPVGKHITDTLDPAALTLTRFIVAVIFLAPVIWLRHGLGVEPRSLLRYGAISGCLAIFFWCMFLSLRYTTALHTSVIFTLVPGLSGIYASLINHERLSRRRLLALTIGLAGALWVIFRGDPYLLVSLSWNKGDAIFFAGCLAMGLYTPFVKRLHRGEPMEVMSFWILVTGCLWLLPVGASAMLRTSWTLAPASTWWWIVYLACFTTVITFYLTQYATSIIGPTRTMAYSYLYPALVMIIDVIRGYDRPELKVLPGIVVIMATMFVLQSPRFLGKNTKRVC